MLSQVYGENSMYQILGWVLVFTALVLTNEIQRRSKLGGYGFFKSLGMDLSTATGIFYRQALRCHGLPFEVKVDEPNAGVRLKGRVVFLH